jgi:hypothetical protein
MIVIHCILHINRDSGYLSSYPWLYHIAKPASSKKKPPLLHIIHTSYLSIPRVYIFLYLHAPPKLSSSSSLPRSGSAPTQHWRRTSACAHCLCLQRNIAAPIASPRCLPWHGGRAGGGAGHRRWGWVFAFPRRRGGMSTTSCYWRRRMWKSFWLGGRWCVGCRWLLGSAMSYACVCVEGWEVLGCGLFDCLGCWYTLLCW